MLINYEIVAVNEFMQRNVIAAFVNKDDATIAVLAISADDTHEQRYYILRENGHSFGTMYKDGKPIS